MILCGKIEDIISQLELFKSTYDLAEDYNYKLHFDVYLNSTPLILISKTTLLPVDDLSTCLSENTDFTLVDKYTYELLTGEIPDNNSLQTLLSKTAPQKLKTEPPKSKTKKRKNEGRSSRRVVNVSSDSPIEMREAISGSPELIEPTIENHDYNCVKVNKPAVFAVKKLSDNYFLLFYRKSVYDAGTDSAFRKYLNEQPGSLYAYKYIHSINNLRSEYESLGLHLRHNGRNELSSYHVGKLLSVFTRLSYL